MSKQRRLLRSIISIHLLLFSAGFDSLSATEIWLAPQASVPPSPLNRAVDFLDMFNADAPWRNAAKAIAVFKLYGSYLEHAPQDQVDKIVKNLNERHIAIAVEAGVMNGPEVIKPACGGPGVEGYSTIARAKLISKKIKSAGGSIAYLAMDEPLWFGRFYKGPPGRQPGCRLPVDQVIDLVMPVLQAYRESFPAVRIGDVEPSGVAYQPEWQNETRQWLRGLRDRLGSSLSFMQLDVPFAAGPQQVTAARRFFNQLEVLRTESLVGNIGIIYNGTPNDRTDKEWIDSAKSHIGLFEQEYKLRPQQAIIQSWTLRPTHALPETDPETLTGLVLYYAKQSRPGTK
ncbi:hypothetical protein [Nitrobacter sp.]|uniref:hypothetical protein n=1 Tax=Nitrobacter sp. TaxID=29420 RepID=UPI003F653D51